MTESQFYERTNENSVQAFVCGAVGSGFMAPVHPLGGHFGGHLRFPQHDEKS